MKTILCFGDSNTYGESPDGTGRLPRKNRWTYLVQQGLGSDYQVIEEGLNGRTTVWDDPVEFDKSGRRHLPVCLKSHAPLDLVIIMLGTNDLKTRFSVTPSDIARSVEELVKIVKKADNDHREAPAQVLLVSPIAIDAQTPFGEVFGDRHEDSLRLGALYQAVAERNGAAFLNMADYAQPSPLDGLHLDADHHRKAAQALLPKIKEIIG